MPRSSSRGLRVRATRRLLRCLPPAVALAGVAGLAVVAVDLLRPRAPRAEAERLVRSAGLTDLVLATDARYLRHSSLADRHAPFQDHPASLEHFPAGALFRPPDHLRAAPALPTRPETDARPR